jgi:antitoxin component YwqK of YwqJK toxin-antitoxin module
MLTETKTDRHHYFVDDRGRFQGEYKNCYTNGQLCTHCFYVDGDRHGECKSLNTDGTLITHAFFVHSKFYRDLIKEPVTDDQEKFMITLETGGKWLC